MLNYGTSSNLGDNGYLCTYVRKKRYLCPEPSCVHHDPARALGDLTGIKKHFSRKHGEKKWKCERCSKKYAVHADWKAYMKTCGSRWDSLLHNTSSILRCIS